MKICFLRISKSYYEEEPLCSPIYFVLYRIPYCIGLLKSTFRVIVNRSKVYPPLADWPADHLIAASFRRGRIHGLRHAPYS